MGCPSCNSRAVLYDPHRGEFACTRCGLVVYDRVLEPGPEWRRKDGAPARADLSSVVDFTRHDLGLGSEFHVPNDVSPLQRARLRRMKFLQKRSKVAGSQERTLRDAMIALDKICEDLAIPKGVKTEASVLYRRAKSKGVTVGRELRQMLGAVIFVTCRMRGIPRTEGEVAEAIASGHGSERRKIIKNVRRYSRLLRQEMNLEVRRISADEYIDKFAVQLGLPQGSIERAHVICRRAPPAFARKSPPFVAAVFVYLAAQETGEKVTLKKVAKAAGVGTSSLSQNTSRLREILAGG